MRYLFILLLGLIGSPSFAGTAAGNILVAYQTAFNGKTSNDGPKINVLCSGFASKAWTERSSSRLIPGVATESSFVDYSTKKTYQIADFNDGKKINTAAVFSDYPVLEETGETDVILGYRCRKAKTSLRSNSIEIWYTTEPGVKGTPSMAYGIPDGLVLKIVRNGNYEIKAVKLEKMAGNEPILPSDFGDSVDSPLYRYLITEKLITTVNVFTDEQISFGNEIHNPIDDEADQVFKFSYGTVILRKVKLPVVPDDTQIYAELYQFSNGDAYDRTGSVFMVPEGKEKSFLDGLRKGVDLLPGFTAGNGNVYRGVVATPGFQPLVELMRFFTPFGIGKFNDQVKVYGQKWEDSTYYKQEVTELLPMLQGERWIGVFIGNYDKGGHKVSLRLRYYPGSMEVEDKPSRKIWIEPLFNTLNVMEMSGQEYGTMFEIDSLRVKFSVPEGVKNIRMRYISTGHGGWDGGDEYNQRQNTVLIDHSVQFTYTPWRCDCGTYRKYNPASGNFWNGITSSDGSRSGWCPGTVTNPAFFPLPNLTPGNHEMQIAIPMGKKEGGSFSSWNVSGILIGDYER